MTVISSMIVADNEFITIDELCVTYALPETFIVEMIAQGLIEAHNRSIKIHALSRIQKALRLQHDLAVNMAGIGVILDLLDEVHTLKRRLKRGEE